MGSNSAIIIFASLLNRDQLLRERICSWWSKFFPLRVDPIFKGLHCPEKQKGNFKSNSPLYKWQKNTEIYPCTLNDGILVLELGP